MSFVGPSGSDKEDMVVSLAILALHDGGVEVSSTKIGELVEATGNTVAGYWGSLYAKMLAGRSIDDLLMKPGAGGGGGGGGAAAPAAAAGGDKKEEKKEEKPKEEEKEADMGGGAYKRAESGRGGGGALCMRFRDCDG